MDRYTNFIRHPWERSFWKHWTDHPLLQFHGRRSLDATSIPGPYAIVRHFGGPSLFSPFVMAYSHCLIQLPIFVPVGFTRSTLLCSSTAFWMSCPFVGSVSGREADTTVRGPTIRWHLSCLEEHHTGWIWLLWHKGDHRTDCPRTVQGSIRATLQELRPRSIPDLHFADEIPLLIEFYNEN